MIAYYTCLLLAAAGQIETSQGGATQDGTTAIGQQTAIGARDNSNTGRPPTGRILSRRETRLETRISRETLTALGQGNEAARTHENPKTAVGRRSGQSGRF